MRSKSAHLKTDPNGSTILNLENFIDDLERASEILFRQLVVDPSIRKNALKVLSKNQIVGMSTIEIDNTDGKV